MSLLDNASLLLTPNAYKASKLYSVIPDNGNGDFTATRATTATRINSSGLVESVALNVPRVDYSLGGCPNILLEPQRTNLALQSSSFDSGSWLKFNTTATANTTISPSGIVDADTMTGNGATTQKGFFQSIAVTNAVTYTISIYAKKNTNNFIQIGGGDSFAVTSFANFNLDTGVLGNVGATASATITNAGNGWYRCTMTAITIFGSTTSIAYRLISSATAASAETNTLSTSVFLWGAQIEAGAYATSFIPTTTASVTRNADTITRNNIFTNGLITASGGTWFLELRNNRSLIRDTGLSELYIGEDGSSFSAAGKQAIAIRNGGGGAVPMSFNYWNGSAIAENYLISSLNPKIAIKFTATTYDVFVNGVKVLSARPISWTLSNVQFLNKLLGTTQFLNQMALFPTPLTDAQCIARTQ